jgi:hypothetical protein
VKVVPWGYWIAVDEPRAKESVGAKELVDEPGAEELVDDPGAEELVDEPGRVELVAKELVAKELVDDPCREDEVDDPGIEVDDPWAEDEVLVEAPDIFRMEIIFVVISTMYIDPSGPHAISYGFACTLVCALIFPEVGSIVKILEFTGSPTYIAPVLPIVIPDILLEKGPVANTLGDPFTNFRSWFPASI